MTIPQKGAAAAFLSYLWWGSMPLYWKALSSVSSSEILGHRVVWSAIFTFALIAVTGQWHKTTAFAVKNKRKTLGSSSAAILSPSTGDFTSGRSTPGASLKQASATT